MTPNVLQLLQDAAARELARPASRAPSAAAARKPRPHTAGPSAPRSFA